MTISKLIVGGFKSLKDPVEIPIAPITFLFGPNSVGKSVVREALLELENRLSVDQIESGLVSSLRALTDTNLYAHQYPLGDEFGDPRFMSTLLGYETEFVPPGTTTMAAENEWTTLGREMYWGLSEKVVRYQFVDSSQYFTHCHELIVDGELVISHQNGTYAPDHDQWPKLPPSRSFFEQSSNNMGILRVNLRHAVTADPNFQSLAKQLLEASSEMPPEWSNRVVWLADSTLHVRINSYGRRIQSWSDSTERAWERSDKPTDHEIAIEAPIAAVCLAINELIRQLEWALAEDINIKYVTGSRTLLTNEQVSTNWLETKLSVDATDYPHFINFGHTLLAYASWLGTKSLDDAGLQLTSNNAVRDKDDFINDVLAKHLFSARRYTLKAEVRIREEQIPLPRNGNRSNGTDRSMNSTLYLQDEQGRELDFNQVGSGISYVLPVLAALWGAKRSLIEQPELHLHPAAQCEMGDVIIRAFNRGRFSIIETHSEHLLLRVLRRIRQTTQGQAIERELMCQPEAVAVLYFSAGEDGMTRIDQLRVSRGGDFMDRWPGGFFEERSSELFDE